MPCSIPIEASRPRISGSSASTGSFWIDQEHAGDGLAVIEDHLLGDLHVVITLLDGVVEELLQVGFRGQERVDLSLGKEDGRGGLQRGVIQVFVNIDGDGGLGVTGADVGA